MAVLGDPRHSLQRDRHTLLEYNKSWGQALSQARGKNKKKNKKKNTSLTSLVRVLQITTLKRPTSLQPFQFENATCKEKPPKQKQTCIVNFRIEECSRKRVLRWSGACTRAALPQPPNLRISGSPAVEPTKTKGNCTGNLQNQLRLMHQKSRVVRAMANRDRVAKNAWHPASCPEKQKEKLWETTGPSNFRSIKNFLKMLGDKNKRNSELAMFRFSPTSAPRPQRLAPADHVPAGPQRRKGPGVEEGGGVPQLRAEPTRAEPSGAEPSVLHWGKNGTPKEARAKMEA